MLSEALRYAQMGWRVLPLIPRGKIPLINGGYKGATNDPYQIGIWWKNFPDANIGLAPEEDVLVIDLDSPGSISSFWDTYGEDLDGLSPPIASTGRGMHIYLRVYPEFQVPLATGVAEGFDLRGMGRGYVLAPPSIHPSGRKYEWLIPLRPPEAIPYAPRHILQRIIRALKKDVPASTSSPSFNRGRNVYSSNRINRLLETVKNVVATAPVGARHTTAVRVGGWGIAVLKSMGAQEQDYEALFSALKEGMGVAGLEYDEQAGIVSWLAQKI